MPEPARLLVVPSFSALQLDIHIVFLVIGQYLQCNFIFLNPFRLCKCSSSQKNQRDYVSPSCENTRDQLDARLPPVPRSPALANDDEHQPCRMAELPQSTIQVPSENPKRKQKKDKEANGVNNAKDQAEELVRLRFTLSQRIRARLNQAP